MTSLLAGPDRAGAATGDPRHRRPLLLMSLGGGGFAALAPLTVCLGVAVVGWFVTDAGSHGEPRDALRVGALGWLMAHGSGLRLDGVALGVMPLLLTLASVWVAWRTGVRVGDAVSGHGPDADAIADGERDWTVPVGALGFALGHLAVTGVAVRLSSTATAGADMSSALLGSLAVAVLAGAPALAVGSGRAAIWAAAVPAPLRAAGRTALTILLGHLGLAMVAFVAALAVDAATAANVVSQLGMDGGEVLLYLLLSAALLPNAVLLGSAYLLGPGFVVGTGTLVAPTGVVLGPLPMFPLLAALPDDGAAPGWVPWLMLLPPVAAALFAARAHRHLPTNRWDHGALRGCVGGVLAGLVLGALMTLAGGAVGPGRMQVVGPAAGAVLVHAVTAFGLGGLVGGLAATWRQRRAERRASTVTAGPRP